MFIVYQILPVGTDRCPSTTKTIDYLVPSKRNTGHLVLVKVSGLVIKAKNTETCRLVWYMPYKNKVKTRGIQVTLALSGGNGMGTGKI